MNHEERGSGRVTWRSAYGLPAGLVVLHAVLAWLARAPGILTGEDDVRYLLLGRALLLHQYREIWSPARPQHHMYPPGYPALLAGWTTLTGDSFSWLVALQIVLSAATLVFTFDALRRITRPEVALGTLFILTVNPGLLHASGEVMSESPLALCFAIGLWASVSMKRGPRQTAILVLVSALAPMMRTVGVVLPAAVVADWLLTRRFRHAAIAVVVFAITIGPLIAWTMSDPVVVSGNSYAADLVHKAAGLPLWRTVLNRVFRNAFFYVTQGIPLNLPTPTIAGTRIDNVLSSLAIVAALAAGIVPAFRRIRVALLALLAMAALLSMWPWPVARYLVPALPLIVPLLLLGVERIGCFITTRISRRMVIAAVFIVSATGFFETSARVAEMQACDHAERLPDSRCMTTDQASFFDVVRYVNDSLPSTARFVAAKAAPLYYYTNRLAIPSAQVAGLDSATFWNRLREEHVGYVVLGSLHASEWPRLAHQLATRCSALSLVASFPPRTYLFRVDAEPAAVTGSASAHDDRACAAVRQYQHDAQQIQN